MASTMLPMPSKKKVSVTVTPELLDEAQKLTGTDNVSKLVDDALQALIDLELEEQWIRGVEAQPYEDDDELAWVGEVPVDMSDIPWED
jgi:post-segregation antitoxin (ccd killing protein)